MLMRNIAPQLHLWEDVHNIIIVLKSICLKKNKMTGSRQLFLLGSSGVLFIVNTILNCLPSRKKHIKYLIMPPMPRLRSKSQVAPNAHIGA